MPRQPRDQIILQAMCNRFVRLMDLLQMDKRQMVKALGYSSGGSIEGAVRGQSFIDVERLHRLATIKTETGSRPNLQWLITGEGHPLIGPEGRPESREVSEVVTKIRRLNKGKLTALNELLR